MLFVPDHVPGVSGSSEEHDLHVWPWHMPAVRGPHERVPNLPEGYREADPAVLELRASGSSLLLTAAPAPVADAHQCYIGSFFFPF